MPAACTAWRQGDASVHEVVATLSLVAETQPKIQHRTPRNVGDQVTITASCDLPVNWALAPKSADKDKHLNVPSRPSNRACFRNEFIYLMCHRFIRNDACILGERNVRRSVQSAKTPPHAGCYTALP